MTIPVSEVNVDDDANHYDSEKDVRRQHCASAERLHMMFGHRRADDREDDSGRSD